MIAFVIAVFSCSSTDGKHCPAVKQQRRRPRGYWRNPKNLNAELHAFAKQTDETWRMPTQAELRSAGRRDVVEAVNRRGTWKSAAESAGLVLATESPDTYWQNFDNLRHALFDFIGNTKSSNGITKTSAIFLPSRSQLTEARRWDLVYAIRLHGGVQRVARLLDLTARWRSRKRWDRFENVAKALLQFVNEFGEPGVMPSLAMLRKYGPRGLAAGIDKFHGGSAVVAKQLGLCPSQNRRPSGFWTVRENRVTELMDLLVELSRSKPDRDRTLMPSNLEMIHMGRSDLANALYRHEGFNKMALSVGLKPNGKARKAKGYWQNEQNLKVELRAFAASTEESWRMPTYAELVAAGRTDIANAVQSQGSWKSAADNAGLVLTSVARMRSWRYQQTS